MLNAAPKSPFGKGGPLNTGANSFSGVKPTPPTVDPMAWDKNADPAVGANGMYVITKSGRRARLTGQNGGVYVDAAPRTQDQIAAEFAPPVGSADARTKAADVAVVTPPGSTLDPFSAPLFPDAAKGVAGYANFLSHIPQPTVNRNIPSWMTNGGWGSGTSGSGTSGGNTYNPNSGSGSGSGSESTTVNTGADQTALMNHIMSLMNGDKIDVPALEAQAAKMAAGQVNNSVQGSIAERNQYVQEAADRAAAVMAAYRAMANMSRGDAAAVQGAYNTAGQDMASVARGFTGGIAPIAGQDARQLQSQLGKVNSPGTATTNTSGFNISTAPTGGGQALYAINGQVPSNNFFQTAARDFAAEKLAPRGIMQQGIDAMQVASHASDSKEQAINNYINAVKAKLPNLTNTALTGLLNNARAAQSSDLKKAALAWAMAKDTRAADLADVKAGNTAAHDTNIDNNAAGRLSLAQWTAQSGYNVAEQKLAAASYKLKHPQAKPLTPLQVKGIVEEAALGKSQLTTNLGKTKSVFTRPPINDEGNAIAYVMENTGMDLQQAINALSVYNGPRARMSKGADGKPTGIGPYDFGGYLEYRARHAQHDAAQTAVQRGFWNTLTSGG